MGDAADALTEAGLDEVAAHRGGYCDDGCRYCLEEVLSEARGGKPAKPEERVVFCGECGSRMRLRWTDKFRRWFYGCAEWPRCDGIHGAHPDGKPLGVPANKATKAARIRAHDAFDRLHGRGRMTRSQAYAWLAKRMKLPEEFCHIGRFNERDCERVVEVAEARLRKGFGRDRRKGTA